MIQSAAATAAVYFCSVDLDAVFISAQHEQRGLLVAASALYLRVYSAPVHT